MDMSWIVHMIWPYLIGAMPIGYLIGRAKGINILKQGSCSIGATNVNRLLGTKWGGVVFVGDVLKGVAGYYLGSLLTHDPLKAVAFGIMAVIGHCFSIFLGFKGGKGMSTTLGVILANQPIPAAIAFLGWTIVVVATRYVSVASVSAALVFTVIQWFYQPNPVLRWVYTCLAALLILKHWSNIKRLRQGTEPKLKLGGGTKSG